MTPGRRRLVLGGSAVITAAALLAEAAFVIGEWRTVRAAARESARRRQERQALVNGHPELNERRLAAVEADLARTQALLAVRLNALEGWCGPALRAPPVCVARSRSDAFFTLTGYVRRMREQAGQAGVGVRAEEQFGFATYAREGPAEDLVTAVESQRQLLERVLQKLWDARPERLEAVQRAPPRRDQSEKVPPRRADEAGRRESEDILAAPSLPSIGTPRLIETTAYRLSFVARTAALRRFLNALAAGSDPLVVREVAAEPVKEAAARPGASAAGKEPVTLLLRPGPSRFTVTFEAFALASPRALLEGRPAAADPPAAGESEVLWPEPAAQPRGADWIYDLFTPPSIYHDAQTRELSAARAPAPGADGTSAFDLKLLAVGRGRFHWQLAGYAGADDRWRGVFTAAESEDTVIAGPGERLGSSGYSVKSLAVIRPAAGGGDDSTCGLMAVAVVRDEVTATEVTLTSGSPSLAGAPQGIFGSRQDSGFRCELPEGRSVELHGAVYCVERIDLDEPQALVARLAAGDGGPTVRRLTPDPPAESAALPPARRGSERAGPALSLSP